MIADEVFQVHISNCLHAVIIIIVNYTLSSNNSSELYKFKTIPHPPPRPKNNDLKSYRSRSFTNQSKLFRPSSPLLLLLFLFPLHNGLFFLILLLSAVHSATATHAAPLLLLLLLSGLLSSHLFAACDSASRSLRARLCGVAPRSRNTDGRNCFLSSQLRAE